AMAAHQAAAGHREPARSDNFPHNPNEHPPIPMVTKASHRKFGVSFHTQNPPNATRPRQSAVAMQAHKRAPPDRGKGDKPEASELKTRPSIAKLRRSAVAPDLGCGPLVIGPRPLPSSPLPWAPLGNPCGRGPDRNPAPSVQPRWPNRP